MKIKLSGVFGRSHTINNAGIGIHVGQGAADRALRRMFRQPAASTAVLTRSPGGSVGVAIGGRAGRIDSDQFRAMLRGGRPASSCDPGTPLAPGPPLSPQLLPEEPIEKQLAPQSPADPAGAPGNRADSGSPAERVSILLASSLSMTMPSTDTQSAVPVDPDLKRASAAIAALADALQPGRVESGNPDDALLSALVERLCAGEARNHALSNDPARRRAALSLIAHQARAIQDATDWPATGAGLIGMGPPDPLIDPLLERARSRALESLMVRAERSPDSAARIRSDVEQIIQLEREAARASSLLEQALGLAGLGASFRLNSFRLDETTIAAIRSSEALGGDPAKVSLVLGACLGLDQRVRSSDAMSRLREDLSTVRQTIATEREGLNAGAARDEHSSLRLERFKLEQLFARELERVIDQGKDPQTQGSLIDLRAGLVDLQKQITAIEAHPDLARDREYARQIRAIDRQLDTIARSAHRDVTAARAGFTSAELAALGLDPAADLPKIIEVCEQFARMGLSAPEQVDALLRTAGLVGSQIGHHLATASPTASDNERLVQNLGRRLLALATGIEQADPEDPRGFRDAFNRALPSVTPPDDDPLTITAAGVADLARESLALKLDRDAAPAPEAEWSAELKREASLYLERSERAADLGQALYELAEQREAARAAIERHHRTGRDAARPLDFERPRGLAMSRALLEVRSLFDAADRSGKPPDPRRLGALAQSLRGFDPVSFSKPRFGGRTPDADTLRAWVSDPTTLELAQAVVVLREDARLRLAVLERKFKETALAMDQAIRARAAMMGPESSKRLTAGIRAAILAELGTRAGDGSLLSSDRPADHFEAISRRLREWGIDTDRYAPEIRHHLGQSFGPTELALWAEDAGIDAATLNSPTPPAKPPEAASAAPLQAEAPAGSDGDSPSAQAGRLIEALELGSSLKLFGGKRWQLGAGVRIGAAATAVKTQQSEIANLEIERGADGYRLTLRAGHEGLYGVDAAVSVTPANTLVSMGAKLGVEASRSLIEGFRLRFKDDEMGRRAMTDLVTKLIIAPETIRHTDLVGVETISANTRRKGMVRLNAQASARISSPKLEKGDSSLGAHIGGLAQAGAGFTTESIRDANLGERGFESVREYSIQASAGLRISGGARVGDKRGAVEDARSEAVELSAEIRYKRSLRYGVNSQGQLTGTQLLKQVRAGVASRAVIERVGGEALAAKMREKPDLRPRLESMMRDVVGSDIIRIRWKLKSEGSKRIEGIMARVNAMERTLALEETRQNERERLRNQGEREFAAAITDDLSDSIARQRRAIAHLRDEIDGLLQSDDNFEPDRISLIRLRDESAYSATLPLLVYERGHYLEQQSSWNQIHLDL